MMSGELKSPVEEALENQPFGALQLRVVLLCALVQAFDGFDIGTIGMLAPCARKGSVGWQASPSKVTHPLVHRGNGSRPINAHLYGVSTLRMIS